MKRVRVVSVAGLVTIQDSGRPGFAHLGVPRGGPLARSQFEDACARVDNDARCAAFEVVGTLTLTALDTAVSIAADGEPSRVLAPNETFRVASTAERRVRYVAVRGGLDVPVVLGGKGTLLAASLGGHEGRLLRKGDEIAIADAPAQPSIARGLPDRRLVHVTLGPDRDAFTHEAVARFLANDYRLSAKCDRVGARLDGPVVESSPLGRSAPLVAGAIEVPGDGAPIVLGPDHPTTGGYPIIAVVDAAEIEKVLAAPVGSGLRFVCRSG